MIERKVNVALTNSFGFGGHNVSLALACVGLTPKEQNTHTLFSMQTLVGLMCWLATK